MTCDMHIHTTNSDGLLDNCEILEECKKRNLKYFSITDHDCVDFYFSEQANKLIEDYDFNVIVGCEFVARVGGQAIEILGYGINKHKAKGYLDKFGIKQSQMNEIRKEFVPSVFKKFGIDFDFNVKPSEYINNNMLYSMIECIKQNPKALALVNAENSELLESSNSFIRKGLNNPKSVFYLSPYDIYPTHTKIIDLIHELGGIASLAHPYQYGDNMNYVLTEVIKAGIDGIECYHFTTINNDIKDYSKKDILLNFCKQNNLIATGGSDFHYLHMRPKNQLNELNIPVSVYNNIKNLIENKHKKTLKKQA
ncbi:MAG: PHP domain-containing protein [Clostridia bacterium]|nr:PHP domain-containing protein [Clostridia bacterium]